MNSSMNIKTLFFLTLSTVVAAPAAAGETEARHQAAAATAQELMQKLGGEVQRQLKAGGAALAVSACTTLAPEYTGEISRNRGWRVTRIGTRVRNPMLGMGDAWEQRVLQRFADQAAKGEPLETMAFSEVVEEPDGKYFRFMKAIDVKKGCLQCHGSDSDIKPEVKAQIEERYPHDRAVGYREGDLRGAVSIKQPLAEPL